MLSFLPTCSAGLWGAAPGPTCEGRAFHKDPRPDQELQGGCGRHVLKTPGREPEASGGRGPSLGDMILGDRLGCAEVLVLGGCCTPTSSTQGSGLSLSLHIIDLVPPSTGII